MKIGYARVSSTGQNIDSQIGALKDIGCEKIFMEKKSAKTTENRIELQHALSYCREGDIFVVTKLDRIARSMRDLSNILKTLDDKNVFFKVLNTDIDTGTTTGKLIFNILGSIAEFERELILERQKEGIEKAKKIGKFKKKKSLTDEQVFEIIELQKTNITNQVIANKFNVARSTLLRYVREYKIKLI